MTFLGHDWSDDPEIRQEQLLEQMKIVSFICDLEEQLKEIGADYVLIEL